MKKKILALCLVVALMATAIAGATLAYFNDVTDEVKNTFTMGKVDIELDEADVKEPNGPRVTENDYTDAMVPGKVFPKDPTIHVKQGSEESYIFLDVTINKFKSLAWVMAKEHGIAADCMNGEVFSTTMFLNKLMNDSALREAILNKWFNGINHTEWKIMTHIVDGDYLTIRLGYLTTVNAKDAAVDIKFMDSFKMPAEVTDEMIAAGKTEGGMQNAFNTDAAKFKMNFKAYAIQTAELEDLAAAYDALF